MVPSDNTIGIGVATLIAMPDLTEVAEDDEEPFYGTIRAKWVYDGATTLAEAAAMLRAEADALQDLHDAGWGLQEPIEDDYGFLVPPPSRDVPSK